jgi:hypothetical protein
MWQGARSLEHNLSTAAAGHFPELLAIAVPGPFFFFGDVHQELQQATEQMQLGGEFGTHTFGFDR